MAARGPVPKRSTQRRRTNVKPDDISTAPGTPDVAAPAADEAWHPVAKMLYASLAESGQSSFYEPSDWAVAYLVCESISMDLREQVVGVTPSGQAVMGTIPLKGASLGAYQRAFTSLLMTEGDRRRAQVELTKPQQADPDEVRGSATITDLQSRLGG